MERKKRGHAMSTNKGQVKVKPTAFLKRHSVCSLICTIQAKQPSKADEMEPKVFFTQLCKSFLSVEALMTLMIM